MACMSQGIIVNDLVVDLIEKWASALPNLQEIDALTYKETGAQADQESDTLPPKTAPSFSKLFNNIDGKEKP